jgi:hypothetical protein
MDTTKVGVATRLSVLEVCNALLLFSECSQRNLISMKVPLLRAGTFLSGGTFQM